MKSLIVACIFAVGFALYVHPLLFPQKQGQVQVEVEAPVKITATWEAVSHNKPIGCVLHRTRVPGGWLIIAPSPRTEVKFLKDPYHAWLK